MSSFTTNLKLTKPIFSNDDVDSTIPALASNFDIIDAAIYALQQTTSGGGGRGLKGDPGPQGPPGPKGDPGGSGHATSLTMADSVTGLPYNIIIKNGALTIETI